MTRQRKPSAPPHAQYERLLSLQQELKTLDEKIKGAKHLNSSPKNKGGLGAIQARMTQGYDQHEKTQKQVELAQLREDLVLAVHHPIKPRGYKELPHFFKFCLFKTTPRRFLVQGKVGEFIEPIKGHIKFGKLEAEVTYFEGELGDNDRMVYLAILNEAIRHKEFVREFGKVPFSLQEIADKAGFPASPHRAEWVQDSLRRLMSTSILFKGGVGDVHFKDRFHLLSRCFSLEKNKVHEQVEQRLQALGADTQAAQQYVGNVQSQATELLAKFKARLPKITMVTFNEPLMQAINGDEITTVDWWVLRDNLHGNPARTLFLYLYDACQWRDSQEPLELTITDLLQLMDMTITTNHKKGRPYPQWSRTVARVKEVFQEVSQFAKFISWFEWVGEEDKTVLRVRLSKEVRQIPSR